MKTKATTKLDALSASRAGRSCSFVVLAAVLASVFVLFAVGAPFCPTAGFLGIPCPGCGLTRAAVALLRGDLERAHELQPLVLVVLPTYAVAFALAVGSALGKTWNPALVRVFAWCGGAVIASMTLVWLSRFAGYWGGPVEVRTYAEWAASLGN